METRPKIKLLLLVLAVCVVFPVIFGEILVSFDAGHECHENHGTARTECHVCLKIEIARNLLKTLKAASACFCLAALLFCLNLKKLKYFILPLRQLSAVALKVRSNS